MIGVDGRASSLRAINLDRFVPGENIWGFCN